MIVVAPPIIRNPEPDFNIKFEDAELIKRIKLKLGNVDACRVTLALLPGCSLKSALDFVNSL